MEMVIVAKLCGNVAVIIDFYVAPAATYCTRKCVFKLLKDVGCNFTDTYQLTKIYE